MPRAPVVGGMDLGRRRLLAALPAALAGCATRETGGRASTTATATADAPSLAASGTPSDVCDRDPRATDVVAIERPAFGTEWPADTGYGDLTPETTVIGVVADGAARAYPLPLLAWHEVVNDDLGGPLLVTYCPLCRSGVVASRRVAGEATTFDVSGLLWKPPSVRVGASEKEGRAFSDREAGIGHSRNLVMVDAATGSYWSQLLARAICGPRTDERLAIRASTVTTWGEWRATHADATVLLPPPDSGLTRPEDAATGAGRPGVGGGRRPR